jgi:hypothetical protein
MTLALLLRPDSDDIQPDAEIHAGESAASLDEALRALFCGEPVECLVCGEPVEASEDSVECRFCGTRIDPAPMVVEGQLELL